MDGNGRIPADQVVPALVQILKSHPDAGIAAVGPDGRFREMPDEVPISGHPILDGRAGIDLIQTESRAIVLEQFRQLSSHGASEVEVRTRAGNPARYALFDTEAEYGVVLLVLIEGDPDGHEGPAVSLADLEPVRPRYGRVRRTDVGELLEVDDGALGMLRYTREVFATLDTATTVHEDDYPAVIGQWFDLLTLPPGTARRSRVRYRCGDDSQLWVELTVTNHLDDPDQPHMLSEMVDISEEMAAVDEVWESRELLKRLTDALPVGVVQVEADRRVVYANDRLFQIVGVGQAPTLTEQFGSVIEDDRHELDAAIDRALTTGQDTDVELRLRPGRSHLLRYSQVAIRALRGRDDEVTGAIICVADVTDSTRMRKELEVRAAFDVLTQCFNRATVMSEIERSLGRPGQRTAVVFVDLDGFKQVNDRLGHSSGDELLKATATALRGVVRGNDVVGRLGGDEFIVLCPDVTDRVRASEIADRLADAISFEVEVCDTVVPVRASLGVAWTDATCVSAEALVAAADAAMYVSKRNGDNRPVLADPPTTSA